MCSKFDVQYDMDTTLFVLMDFETTGPNVYKDRVCQIGACVWPERGEDDSFMACVNPQYPMSAGAYNTHHIEPHRYAHTVGFSVVLRRWQAWIAAHVSASPTPVETLVLCAHNGNTFDFKLLVAEMVRYDVFDGDAANRFGLPLIPPRDVTVHVCDSLVVFRELCPELPSKALGALHEALCGRPIQGAHDALADVHAMRNVLDAKADGAELVPELQRASTPFEECVAIVRAAIASKKIDLHPVVLFVPSGLPFSDGRYIFQGHAYPYWDVTTRRRYRIETSAASDKK